MAISKFLTISGFGLLVLCFAISVGRVVRHGRKHSDPEKVIVRYAHHIQEESVEAALRAIASAYERDHPGVFIEEVVIPKSVYRSWVQTKLVGNMATDLILLDTVPAREQIMFHFVILNAFMDNPNPYNRGTKLEDMTWRETFVDHLIGPPTYWDSLGSYWGVPLGANTTRVLYNRDLLRRITQKEGVPTNYAEFVALCEKVRGYSEQNGVAIYPIAAAGRDSLFIRRLIRSQTLPLALRCDWSRNLEAFYQNVSYLRGRWSFEDEEIHLGLQLAREVCAFMQPGFLQHLEKDTIFYFGQGRALMILADSGMASSIREQVSFEVGAFEIPLPDKDHPVYGRYVFGRTSEGGNITRWAFGLTRQSRHPGIALDFLHYLTSLKVNQQFADMTGNVPSIVGASVPEDMEVFAPKVDGYPEGIDPGGGGETAALSDAHFHLLLSARGGLDAYLDAMRRGYFAAAVRDIHSTEHGIIEKTRYQDTNLTAKWLMQTLGITGEKGISPESWEDAMGRILFSQVNNASDRHWRRLELANLGIAEGGGW